MRRAVEATGKALAALGHTVEAAEVDIGGLDTMRRCNDVFFFAFDARLDGYAKRAGTKPGPDTLEPVIAQPLRVRQGHHAGPLHWRR